MSDPNTSLRIGHIHSCSNFIRRCGYLRDTYRQFFLKQCGSDAPFESLTAWFLYQFSANSPPRYPEYLVESIPTRDSSPLTRFLKYSLCRPITLADAAYSLECFLKSAWNESLRNCLGEYECLENGLLSCSTSSRQWLKESFYLSDRLLLSLSQKYRGTSFEVDVYLLFKYYDAVFGFKRGEGRGWHLSIPASFHSPLEAEFGVCCEVFASPVNSQSPYYFSLFEEVDAAFSSLGNFFNPRHTGSLDSFRALFGCPAFLAIEANPPFEPLLMIRMLAVLENLLTEAVQCQYRLLFALVLPDWSVCDAVEKAKVSSFTRHTISLPKGTHEYSNGWPYHSPVIGRRPVWNDSDSVVVFMSSESMDISDELATRIRLSWASIHQ